MRLIPLSMVVLFALTSECFCQESWKVEVLKQPPPQAVAPEIRSVLGNQGFRIRNEQGQSHAEIWLRRAIPISGKPNGPKGAIQFPYLKEGELLGSLQFTDEGHDYRDQPITKGVYTLRYGLQPVNGDHLGVSTYRDYSLLLPASKDRSLDLLQKSSLRSVVRIRRHKPSCRFHHADARRGIENGASIIRDAEKDTWSVVLPLTFQVPGQGESIINPVRLVIDGAAQP